MTCNYERLEIRAAHRYSTRHTSWYWGWLAIDMVDRTAVGIVTARLWEVCPFPEVQTPYALVGSLYARKHPGLGVHLLVHARDELAHWKPGSINLYRTGQATQKGREACDTAGLPLNPDFQHLLDTGKLASLPVYKEELAVHWGRKHLETAADWFGVAAVPAKDSELALLSLLPESLKNPSTNDGPQIER
ncbi:hypothetical protein [Nocardia sp. NPDC056000]|uniref:hypothetical protein n=1 Tax=Nocardia sp. NPDC056000 TaxID=3345674 RepID=UPI0035D78795